MRWTIGFACSVAAGAALLWACAAAGMGATVIGV
jgi:hypothetical protein